MAHRFIPEWLLPFKNEYRSAIGLHQLFTLQHVQSAALYDVQACINKFGWKKYGVQQPYGNSFVRRYRVKDILARARANDMVAVVRPACSFVQGQTHDAAIRDEVNRRLAQKDAHIIEQEREINSLFTLLSESEKRCSELEHNLSCIKSRLHTALHATDIQDTPGLYFMCDSDEIVYVGLSTTSVKSRVNGRANLVKSCRMIPFSDNGALREAEQDWIRLLNPKGNIQFNDKRAS